MITLVIITPREYNKVRLSLRSCTYYLDREVVKGYKLVISWLFGLVSESDRERERERGGKDGVHSSTHRELHTVRQCDDAESKQQSQLSELDDVPVHHSHRWRHGPGNGPEEVAEKCSATDSASLVVLAHWGDISQRVP